MRQAPKPEPKPAPKPVAAAPQASAPAASNGWRALFNGKDLEGWVCDADADAWEVDAEGVLFPKAKGNLYTRERFGDFVLDLEFKNAPQNNSGVFFRIDDPKSWVQTGIEIQIYDSFGKTELDKHSCGALYDCQAPLKNAVKQPGEWNRMILTVKGPQVYVVLNGELVVDANLDDWTEAEKNPDGTKNKFKTAIKDFKREGHIGLQYHGNPIWFRNIRIKPLS